MANVLVSPSVPVITTEEFDALSIRPSGRVMDGPTERLQLNQIRCEAARNGKSTGEKNVAKLLQSVCCSTSHVPSVPVQELFEMLAQPGGFPLFPVSTDWASVSRAVTALR